MRCLLSLLLLFSLTAHAASISYFYDGDTVKISDNGYEYKLRITDIDAPERNQAYGKKSRRALINFCKNASVQVYITGTDKYLRRLGQLHCNGQDASHWMLQNGHAWFNQRYSMNGNMLYAEQTARQQKLGLWANQSQTPPWVWRKNHPYAAK
jgi:endonuclease YncB( thermonuclease family)